MHQVDPKDGYSVGDYRNDWQRRLLKFLVPIVHPDKPTRVTITIGNTIFDALDGGRKVDWGVVFRDMAKGLENPNPPPFAHFCFICTRVKVCLRQTRSWTTGRPRRWPDTGSPRIRIRGPELIRTSLSQLQRHRLDRDLRGRPTRGRNRRIGRHPDLLQSGPRDRQAQFHRKLSRGRNNRVLNRKEDRNGWRNPLLA